MQTCEFVICIKKHTCLRDYKYAHGYKIFHRWYTIVVSSAERFDPSPQKFNESIFLPSANVRCPIVHTFVRDCWLVCSETIAYFIFFRYFNNGTSPGTNCANAFVGNLRWVHYLSITA